MVLLIKNKGGIKYVLACDRIHCYRFCRWFVILGMFNEKKYSHYYNTWENTLDGGNVILLSIIWPLTLAGILIFLIYVLIEALFDLIVNIGYNITH